MKLKKIYIIWVLVSVIIVFANVRDSIRLENYIQRQVNGYLSRVLPSNSYLVTVSVDAQTQRKQELKNEVVDNYLKEENITPTQPVEQQPKTTEEPTLEILPGLGKLYDPKYKYQKQRNSFAPVPNPEPTRNFREEESRTSKEYSYIDELDIREVSVQVVFDDSLNPNLVQSVKNLIGSKLDITFGDRATVIFSTVDLDQVKAVEEDNTVDQIQQTSESSSIEEESIRRDNSYVDSRNSSIQGDTGITNRDFDYYLDKYDSLFYLLISIIVFIILLLLFIFFLWLFLRMFGKKNKEEEKSDSLSPSPMYEYPIPVNLSTPSEASPDAQESSPPVQPYYVNNWNARQKEENFLDQFLREPLLSRRYFLNLPEEDQNELLSALVSNATKVVFRDIANNPNLGTENLWGTNFDNPEVERARDLIFSKHIDGINQYSKIYGPQIRDVFSKLSFFTEDEIKTLFNSIGLQSAAIIAKNVDSQKMVPYLDQLGEQRRKEFLKIFNDDRELSQDEMEEFKRKLRIKIDELSKNIFIRKADNKFIKRKLLESSTDKKKFLESIKNEDPDFYHEFKSYTVDMMDFMADNSTVFNRTVQSAENEDLTLIIIGAKNPEFRDRIMNALPPVRREFVLGYVSSRQSNATREEITDAQNNVLDIYRSFLV